MNLQSCKTGVVLASLVACVTTGLLAVEPGQRTDVTQSEQDARRQIGAGSRSVAEQLSSAFGDVAESIRRSVVSISALQRTPPQTTQNPFGQDPLLRRFFGDQWMQIPPENQEGAIRQGLGSGFILDREGHVVTNHHVIGNASEVRVTLWDERTVDAEVVGGDPKTDIAVLKIEADDLHPVEFGDSEALRVGEWVVAAGNPFGLSSTITTGIVSATGRARMGLTDYEYFIQTDAAINPGNSGGPLVDLQGRVVGINSAIFTRSGGSMGIGFAIPVAMANPVIDSLIRTGKVVRGFLGVMIQDIDQDLARSFGFDRANGALVGDVTEDSPAEEAGLRQGDIITHFNGKQVEDVAQLRMEVAGTAPGAEVEIEIFRDGDDRSLTVEIGELEGAATSTGVSTTHEELGWNLRELNSGLRRELGYGEDAEGVVVTRVKPNSPAARAGLRTRDLIIRAGNRSVTDTTDLQRALKENPGGVRLTIRRDNSQMFAFLRLPR